MGTLSSAVPNTNVGWHYTVDQLSLFFEHTLAIPQEDPRVRDLGPPNIWAPADPAPPIVGELLGNYLDSIRVLARRTSEMHTALSSRPDVTDFAPEPFTTFYRQSVYHGMLGQLNRAFELLRSRTRTLAPEVQAEVSEVLNRESDLRMQLLTMRDKRMSGTRIRNHGDYHLSNVLFTGSDWVITNFEGDPGRPLSERRIKRVGPARCRHHAALVPLRVACGAVRRCARYRPQPRSPSTTGEVGAHLVSLGQRHLPEALLPGERRGVVPAVASRRNARFCLAPT